MPTPEYSADLTTAFQETHVFKFAHKTVTRFICQIRICMRSEECQNLTVGGLTSLETQKKRIDGKEGLLTPGQHYCFSYWRTCRS
ncbi:unnamed protein product [Nippostrongylus brasiliensis]|uniref:ZP domain-containing protein n=1 Tax=Nippostrongylus brasiliensis TaxID=27835 RepID=A0A0N4XR21_NIPBR|nr:unnamed protein product [Nippostrongylus brasiliensis]